MKLRLIAVLAFFCIISYADYIVIDNYADEPRTLDNSLKLETIPLGKHTFTEIEFMCRSLLGKNGTLSHEEEKNEIIVNDSQPVINVIKALLSTKTRSRQAIRIDVLFDNLQDLSSVDWKKNTLPKQGGSITIQGGQYGIPEGMSVEVPLNGIDAMSASSDKHLVTRNGMPSTLWVGKGTVSPLWLNRLIAKGVLSRAPNISLEADEELMFLDVVSTLRIKPIHLKNNMFFIDVFPEISFKNKNQEQVSCVLKSLKASQAVSAGQRINIGGIIKRNSSTYKQLFGTMLYRRNDNKNISEMFIRPSLAE